MSNIIHCLYKIIITIVDIELINFFDMSFSTMCPIISHTGVSVIVVC